MNTATHTEATQAQAIFTQTFAAAREIAFNPRWHNGTGYFDALVASSAVTLSPGEIVRSLDDDGRRLVIIGTAIGNIVVFDRYNGNEVAGNPVFAFNGPVVIGQIVQYGSTGRVSAELMAYFLGDPCYPKLSPNLGLRLDVLFRANARALEREAEPASAQ